MKYSTVLHQIWVLLDVLHKLISDYNNEHSGLQCGFFALLLKYEQI